MRTVYRNARVYGAAAPGPGALVVEDGVLAWVGAEDGVGSGAAAVVDLGGRLVTPAFVDAHVHLTSTGLSLTGLDLSGARSLADALALVARAARSGRGRPLVGGGWDETGWPEGRPPTAAELDRAGYGGSVYLARVDAHSAVVSSALMAAVPGIAGRAGHRADGWLTRAAHDAARSAAFAALTAGQLAEAQRAALGRAASLGIGCVHEMAGPAISSPQDLASALAIASAEPVPEVVGYWGELFGTDTARELGAVGAGGDLFCDGSLGSHTAALHEPYSDDPSTRGALRFETGDLVAHIEHCVSAGLQAGFHAIGDAAVDQVLDAFEAATARLGRPAGAGSRIEHAEFVAEPARLAASGLTASMQPMFDATWGGPRGMYAARLGAGRAGRLNRFADLAAARVPLAFGSDAPVTELGPWQAVRAAAFPSVADVALSPHAAFVAHTAGGRRAGGDPAGGRLVPGAPATFAVWEPGGSPGERPVPRTARAELPDVSPGGALPLCALTVVRGAVVYQRDA